MKLFYGDAGGTWNFLLSRALTKVQVLIVRELFSRNFETKTKACREISRKYKLALSTVKYNYAALERAKIVSNGKLTCKEIGELVH